MSKLYNKPVEVRLAGDVPDAFFWLGKWLRIVSSERVFVRREMYDPFYGLATVRVKVQGGGLYDLVRPGRGGCWRGCGINLCRGGAFLYPAGLVLVECLKHVIIKKYLTACEGVS